MWFRRTSGVFARGHLCAHQLLDLTAAKETDTEREQEQNETVLHNNSSLFDWPLRVQGSFA